MARLIKKGATSQSLYVVALDSASTTGGRKTGIAFNTASLTGYYVRNGGSATAITLATLAAANSAWSSGGFKEVDATNMPGVYRLDVPDAALASGAESVVVTLKGASGLVQIDDESQLVAIDPQDTVRGGMTALPNAAAAANGGLPTGDANNSVKTQGNVKKNTALANFEFMLTDSTNHAPKTSAASIVPTRSIDGGAFGAGTLSSVTEVAFGIYRVDFAAADLNGNVITLRVTATSCDDSFDRIITFV